MDISSTTIDIGGKTLTLETGRFAERASAAVTARMGDTKLRFRRQYGHFQFELT